MKTEHVDAITRFLRRLRPGDVLLPIGAALITAGLQNLADREARGRGRLAELATLAADHLEALSSAGVEVPDELAADELHPLDPEVPWLAQYATPVPDDDEPAPAEQRRRRWKLVGFGLAAATGITLWNNREQIGERLGIALGYPYGPPGPETPDEPGPNWPDAAAYWRGDHCTTCDQPAAWVVPEQSWRHVVPPDGKPRWSSHEVTLPAAVNESNAEPSDPEPIDPNMPNAGRETPAAPWSTCLPDNLGNCANKIHSHSAVSAEPVGEPDAVSVTPREACTWPNCDWTSDPRKSVTGQATQAAWHHNRCIYRPAGAQVTQ